MPTPTQPSTPAQRRDERGSATLIAILALFGLLSLGLIAMRSAQDDVANAGNIRRTKQAQYLAEVGLHHAATLLQQQGNYLLSQRGPREYLTITQSGVVRYWLPNPVDPEAAPTLQKELNTPPFPALIEGPSPLELGALRVPSYEVRVEGFSDAGAPPGQEISQDDLGTPQQRFCLLQFSSRGFIASQDNPEATSQALGELAWRASLVLHVERQLKAGLVVGPFLIPACGP